MPMLKYYMTNQYRKFKVSSFSHSGDNLEGSKNLNGSRGHNHALSRSIWHRWAGTSCDQAVYQIRNIYVHPLQRYN